MEVDNAFDYAKSDSCSRFVALCLIKRCENSLAVFRTYAYTIVCYLYTEVCLVRVYGTS